MAVNATDMWAGDKRFGPGSTHYGQSGSGYMRSDYQTDERGIPYTENGGQRFYLPPDSFDAAGHLIGASPQSGSGASFTKNGQEWDTTTGTWKNDTNWGNLIGLGTAGAIGGFGAAGALGAGAATAAPAAASSGAPGGLASTTIGSGMIGPVGGASSIGVGGVGGGSSLFANPSIGSLLKGAGTASQIGGASAAAAGTGRAQQAGIQQNQDRNALGLYTDQLAAAQQALNQHSQLAKQAGQGDLTSNVQDVNITGLPAGVTMGNVTGGLRPSLLGPNARQAGATLSRNALLQLLAGDTNLPKPPALTPLPTPGAMDTVNQGLGTFGAYAGALSPLFSGGR